MGILSDIFYVVGVIIWDALLTLGNLVRPSLPIGHVTPVGHAGFGGHWPEYKAPQEGDSRCACPALNALANHGIIARSGRNLKFTDVMSQVPPTYNFAPSFCSIQLHFAAFLLKRDYNKDTFDLEELNLHNGIEHDASLTRLDTALQPNQAIKCAQFIKEMLSFATGYGNTCLTINDMSRISGKRRAEAQATNRGYSLDLLHKLIGSANAAFMLKLFGGRTDDLRAFLLEERIPEGWESRFRKPNGLTLIWVNFTLLPIELGIRESYWMMGSKQLGNGQSAVAEKGV